MISRTTSSFRSAYAALPQHIRCRGREAYRLLKNNPYHPSLWFRKVHNDRDIFSVRITLDYRALGTRVGEEIVLFWIGSHQDYERLIS